jgi:hypothetical protein
VKVAPDIYKVLLENDAVRVLEIRMKQDEKSEMHSHPRSVEYVLNSSQAKFLPSQMIKATFLTLKVVR